MGFWTFGNDEKWESEEKLNLAFDTFIEFKNKYGDQFEFIVSDLNKETASLVNIKIIVNPPNPLIENELKSLGLIYVND